MAGYQTTNYGDLNKTGIAITLASAHEIEMDQQRPDNATIDCGERRSSSRGSSTTTLRPT